MGSGTTWPGGEFDFVTHLTLVSCRELNNNRKSQVDQNDKLNMSLLKETCFAHRVQFRSSVHFSKYVNFWKKLGLRYLFSSVNLRDCTARSRHKSLSRLARQITTDPRNRMNPSGGLAWDAKQQRRVFHWERRWCVQSS